VVPLVRRGAQASRKVWGIRLRGDGQGVDFTVHIVVGVDPDDNLYILDIWRKQATTDIWIDQMIGLMQKHKPIYHWAAPADQIKRSVGPFLTRRMAEARTYVSIKEMSEAGDKPTKARSFQGRLATGKVYFPKQAEWLDDLVMGNVHVSGGARSGGCFRPHRPHAR
jgi:predicted phage terminase large subunit-like protein